MAELDYAYLAEYAQITNGNLTAVNASFVHMRTPIPSLLNLAVAGRVRAPADAGDVTVDLGFQAPNEDAPAMTLQMNLNTEGNPVYNNKVGILFAARVGLLVAVHGLYAVKIHIDGEEVRTLAFEALAP